jgi:hypothetical protein
VNEETIECPGYRVCSLLGIEVGPWCRYRESALPPPGMHNFRPKDTWCPPGMRATVLMLGYMIAGEGRQGEELADVLGRVREWAGSLRPEASTHNLMDGH